LGTVAAGINLQCGSVKGIVVAIALLGHCWHTRYNQCCHGIRSIIWCMPDATCWVYRHKVRKSLFNREASRLKTQSRAAHGVIVTFGLRVHVSDSGCGRDDGSGSRQDYH